MVGSPIGSFTMGVVGPYGFSGTVNVRNSNNYSGGTIVNRGSVLTVQVAGPRLHAAGHRPIEVMDTATSPSAARPARW